MAGGGGGGRGSGRGEEGGLGEVGTHMVRDTVWRAGWLIMFNVHLPLRDRSVYTISRRTNVLFGLAAAC